MNYLAHVFLAGPAPADRVGGLIGDFVKGVLDPPPPGLDAALIDGVRLHRSIDSFADRHPAFQRSRARVSAARRRVSGIMVDLFYDHFLARHWTALAGQRRFDARLPASTSALYREVGNWARAWPPSFIEVFARMAAHDWLASYASSAAVALALDRMAHHRLRQPNALAGAGAELLDHYDGFEADFFLFIADAEGHAAALREGRRCA